MHDRLVLGIAHCGGSARRQEWPESLRDSDVRLALRNALGLIMLEYYLGRND